MVFTYWTITIFGIPFQGISANQISSKCSPSAAFLLIRNTPDIIFLQLQMHNKLCVWFRLFPFRSPLLREYCFAIFLAKQTRNSSHFVAHAKQTRKV